MYDGGPSPITAIPVLSAFHYEKQAGSSFKERKLYPDMPAKTNGTNHEAG